MPWRVRRAVAEEQLTIERLAGRARVRSDGAAPDEVVAAVGSALFGGALCLARQPEGALHAVVAGAAVGARGEVGSAHTDVPAGGAEIRHRAALPVRVRSVVAGMTTAAHDQRRKRRDPR